MFPRDVVRALCISPPRAYTVAGVPGMLVVVAVSTVAAALDLTKLNFGLAYSATDARTAQGNLGVVGNELTIWTDTGADLGIIVGPTLASVTGANVPVLATVGTVNANGIYTAVTGACFRVPAASSVRFLTAPGQDLFLGFVGSAAGIARIFQSSVSGA